jgi:hypothetical protein
MSKSSNNRAAWLEGPSAECEPVPTIGKPWGLVLLGAPGVGKGTQAELLEQRLGDWGAPEEIGLRLLASLERGRPNRPLKSRGYRAPSTG